MAALVINNRNSRGGHSKGRGLNIRWSNRFKPPKNTTTKIRLIPGSYKGFDGAEYPFFQYVEFFSARANRGFCSTGQYEIQEKVGLTKVGGNCLGWDEYQKETEEGGDRSISMRVLQAWTAIHLDWFHEVEALDEDGKVKKYEKGKRAGEVITNKEQCGGRKCDYCKDKYPKVFGKKVHWSIGSGHLESLFGIMNDIGRDCMNCKGSATIEILSYDCEECGKIVVDMSKYNMQDEADAKEVAAATSTEYKCKCGHTALPLPQHECSDCQDPTPLSIFDCDIEIKSVGENTQSAIQVPRWTRTELSDDLKKMAEPWDFSSIFFGDDLRIQMKALKLRTNPYAGEDGGSEKHARDYGKKEEDAPRGRRGRRGRDEEEEGEDRPDFNH
jgi:hypothetical protein